MKVGMDMPASLVIKPATSQLQPLRTAKPVAMQIGTAALLRGPEESSLFGEEVKRFIRVASSKPTTTARVVVRKSMTAARSAIFDAESSSGSSSSSSTVTDPGALNESAKAYGLYTTVEELRAEYGTGRTLDAAETRDLYHSLLPTQLLHEEDSTTLAERAQIAIAARRAARLYARERTMLPLMMGSELYDGMRHLLESGSFKRTGLSDEEIWHKYAGYVPSEGESLPEQVYYTIIEKACSSNQHIDAMCAGVRSAATAAAAAAAAVGTAAGVAASEYGA